jgi:hypothetical protein
MKRYWQTRYWQTGYVDASRRDGVSSENARLHSKAERLRRFHRSCNIKWQVQYESSDIRLMVGPVLLASNDFGSGPRVLMYSFIMVFTLFLLAGPEQMVPYLMEIVCTIIPAQCMLYAIAALRHDFNKDKGERGTVGGEDIARHTVCQLSVERSPTGNVNQRLWYCVFWCWTQ